MEPVSILENIHGHDDLVRLTDSERKQLCQEIREFLISHVAQTGGHLASNLGAVELTVAIETVYNTIQDRLVFDVGHQSYVHKLLTGRQADFGRLRQFGGIAGFPKPSESDADAFVAGHASSSVSIALGMARARTLLQETYDVVALLGDGAATGGMIYEGLNDAAVSREPLVIILNDNEMSIDKNVGGMARHLNRLRTKEKYLGAKKRYRTTLQKIPGGTVIYRFTKKIKDRIKRMVLPTTLFENMGIQYLGPVDGHDLPGLISLLRVARDRKAPVLVHVITRKGCGYSPAEAEPARFHGIGKFDPATGADLAPKKENFSGVFGRTLEGLAEANPRVCAITAAMPGGTGLLSFQKKFPTRTFDVGIAEEHAISMAGGLAKQGMVPVVALYSTFLQRGYDQILQDIAMLKLHVVLAVDRAGLVGEDGETHHGVYDVGFLRHAPGMTLLTPASCAELPQMLTWAVQECTGPVAIRYPRGGDGVYQDAAWDPEAPVVCHRSGTDGAILTYGTLVNNALAAAELLTQQGLNISVLRLTRLNPLPLAGLEAALSGCRKLLIAEEAFCEAGIASTLSHHLRALVPDCHVRIRDLGQEYVTHGSTAELYQQHGLDAQSLASAMQEVGNED